MATKLVKGFLERDGGIEMIDMLKLVGNESHT